jgi:hypothetical protein
LRLKFARRRVAATPGHDRFLNTRCTILPDPRFASLRPALAERLAAVASSVQPGNFGSLLDPLMQEVLRHGFAEATAHEGSVWLLDADAKYLVPAYNTGPEAARLIGKMRQPLDKGIVCMVFANEQPFLENQVYKNQLHSTLVDESLDQQTCAQIAVPFYFLKVCRGVVSCVQLKRRNSPAPDPPGFLPEHLTRVQRAATLLSRLLELRLLSSTLGWNND